MKTELKAKFLQHISQKKRDGGFTLIELLVVIIIIGILSAIALPSFLNQANKARESEARTYVGSINRAQQAFYMENANEFSEDIKGLGLGINSATANYTYNLAAENEGATQGAVVNANGAANLRDFAGLVWTGETIGGESTTLAKLCEAPDAGTEADFDPGDDDCDDFRAI
ncbi:type IV pilin-like G/H family protein [Limnospira platensis]|uniref:type IV pilin-like G/H family protein n=1 Tax=Limnospira platensis TaxID=118562 RepID=UPI000280438C|nr:general secretion pathway protein H [Arthrospira platensis C1]UWU48389.1 prepilin-type N-terminal cleavage/methylation domain-containing protein [Arthrospira platensis C1]